MENMTECAAVTCQDTVTAATSLCNVTYLRYEFSTASILLIRAPKLDYHLAMMALMLTGGDFNIKFCSTCMCVRGTNK